MKANKLIFILAGILFACQPSKKENLSRVDVLPFYQDPSFTPQWFDEENKVPDDFHRIPPFSLINQSGEVINEESFSDKIYVVDFFFTTCPGICPKMTKNMSIVQEAFKDDGDVLIMSHSVTPEYDSVSVLRKYADEKGVIDSKWHLVTGERKVIYDLGRNYYFVEENLGLQKSEDDFLHTENFVLVDENRHIRGIYNGLNKTSVNQLITDIKTLQKGPSI